MEEEGERNDIWGKLILYGEISQEKSLPEKLVAVSQDVLDDRSLHHRFLPVDTQLKINVKLKEPQLIAALTKVKWINKNP